MKLEKWVSSSQITSKWISYASQALVTTDWIVTWQTDKIVTWQTDKTVTWQTWQDSDQWLVKPDKTVTSVWSNLTRQRPVTSQTSWQWPLTKHHKLWPVKPNSDHWPVKLHMPCWPLTKHHKPWLNLVTFTTDQSNLTWLWQLTSQTSWKWPMTSQTSQDSDQWSVNPNDSDCWPVKAHDSNHSPSNGMTVTTDQPVTTDQ